MSTQPTSFATTLYGLIKKVEIALWLALVLGLLLHYSGYPAKNVLTISLSGLAIVFFLGAYQPSNIIRGEDEKLGFVDLLYLIIAPKLVGISMAVSLIGILFYFINANIEGTKQMLFLGSMSGIAASLVIGIGVAIGAKNSNTLLPILYRSVPIAIASVYLLTII
jgi:hypothetical protein